MLYQNELRVSLTEKTLSAPAEGLEPPITRLTAVPLTYFAYTGKNERGPKP